MPTVGYAELPVPGGGDAPAGPGALTALATAIDPHLLHHVVNKAERDAEFATAPLHTAVTAEDGSLWIKTSAVSNTWATIWEPEPAWRPLPLATGFEADQTDPEVKRIGNLVHVRGRIRRTDGTNIVSYSTVLATVPSDCVPSQLSTYTGGSSLTGDPVVGVARLEVYSPSNSPAGAILIFSQDGADGFTWVDLSGSYWID